MHYVVDGVVINAKVKQTFMQAIEGAVQVQHQVCVYAIKGINNIEVYPDAA